MFFPIISLYVHRWIFQTDVKAAVCVGLKLYLFLYFTLWYPSLMSSEAQSLHRNGPFSERAAQLYVTAGEKMRQGEENQ